MTDTNPASHVDETSVFRPKFGSDGLIVVATTCASTNRLLMIAYMNEDALTKTIETGDAWYWSRSRQELWRKGATSGNQQKVREIRIDCDQDAIELVIDQSGPACHTNRANCFYRRVEKGDDGKIALSFSTEP